MEDSLEKAWRYSVYQVIFVGVVLWHNILFIIVKSLLTFMAGLIIVLDLLGTISDKSLIMGEDFASEFE